MREPSRRVERHHVRFGSREIEFDLRFADRRHLAITVHPDLRVTVTAPRERSADEVLARVRKRAAWIVRQLTRFEGFHPLPPRRQYVSGETHRYLGRQYRLKVVSGDKDSVRMGGPFIFVTTKDARKRSRIRRLLQSWYRERAHVALPRYLERCLSAAKSLELDEPRIEIRRLAKRWGSCTRARTIILNTELVRTPPYCIEYVIMHELCHLRVHNHSRRFFELLSRCMPDWERRKARLDCFLA